jgi:hypothetical protein
VIEEYLTDGGYPWSRDAVVPSRRLQFRTQVNRGALTARGKRENSGSEMPFLTVKTTGETPVPQFCHGLSRLGLFDDLAEIHLLPQVTRQQDRSPGEGLVFRPILGKGESFPAVFAKRAYQVIGLVAHHVQPTEVGDDPLLGASILPIAFDPLEVRTLPIDPWSLCECVRTWAWPALADGIRSNISITKMSPLMPLGMPTSSK